MILAAPLTVALANAGAPFAFDVAVKRDPRLRGDDAVIVRRVMA